MLFVSHFSGGGAERVASNLCAHWAEAGHEVIVVTLANPRTADYALHPRVERVALGLMHVSDNALAALSGNLRRVRALRRLVRERRPEVLIGFMTSSNVVAILAAAGTGCRVIVSERCHPPNTDAAPYWLLLRRYLYKRAYAVVVLAEQSRQWIRSHTGARCVHVIPNMVSWPLTVYPGSVTPPAITGRRLLAVGRLVHEKNHPALIDAFAELAPDVPDWRLSIVGGGDRDPLLRRVRDAGLQDRVDIVGQAGNVAEWYASAEAYVLSSRSEGFPNSLVEAMAAGLPVLAVDCATGPRDIIDHERNGLLVPPDSHVALVAGLRRLLCDEALRGKLAAAAPEVITRFSPTCILSSWDELIGTAHGAHAA